MSGIKKVVKGGWHPEKDSWRGDFKGINQVASLVGKGKKTNASSSSHEHRSAPLSTLKDPAVFGPPPKHVNFHGPAEVAASAPPAYSSEEEDKVPLKENAEGRARSGPPPVPVRANTTVSAMSRKENDVNDEAVGTDQLASRSKPPVPPRLPPRGSSDTATIQVNQGALKRLGQAGISVSGFDIGEKPSALTPQSEGPTTNPLRALSADRAKANQVKDPGSRFSKLSTSSASSAPAGSPNEGSSFAEKQSALRTASSLYRNPTSVSVADATSAASTANNFRQRHGAQVAQGWKAANNLNDKLGLTGTGERRPQRTFEDDPPSTEPQEQPPMAGKATLKKSPPPPPPKKRELTTNTAGATEPPSIPLAKLSIMPKDLDLDLDSLWFAKQPIAFPPPSMPQAKNQSYKLATSWTQLGSKTTYTLTVAIQWAKDMSLTRVRLTWNPSRPRDTVRAEQKHILPPAPLSATQLAAAQQRYGGEIVRWCRERLGTRVGDGECWTLAHDALEAVAAKCKSRGQEPVMTSQGRVHGVCIYVHRMPSPGSALDGLELAQVAPGDILELRKATFHTQRTPFEFFRSETNKHTAVITGVANGVLTVLQQNVLPARENVAEGRYDLRDMIKGEMRIYRPVGESWIHFDLEW
ncbi:MAG: hypothetical protein M1816_005972 [Peltula sp. TS41687]|nr:MAG: hypothetical protein M1816_005972 [Peltula sp. TS41687]